jgi:hypothetical protein
MLASFPASMVNQKPADLGIPNRFNLTTSRFSQKFSGKVRYSTLCGLKTDIALALQLPFMQVSESMGNHDSKIVDAASVD